MKRALERRTGVGEDWFPMRDEHALDGKIAEVGLQRRADLVRITAGDPLLGEAKTAVRRAEEHVPGDERSMRGDPEEDLERAMGVDGHDGSCTQMREPAYRSAISRALRACQKMVRST